ncbi:MAG: hypothetical protein RSC99_08830 [Clostridiales bacterium]
MKAEWNCENKKCGSITVNGKEYILEMDAEWSYDDIWGDPVYSAYAKDAEGNRFVVYWETTKEWNELTEKYRKGENVSEIEVWLEDESNACDWDNVYEIAQI